MCELCSAKTKGWQEHPIPRFYLCRATVDGNFMKAGNWGMGVMNDPEFFWSVEPMKDPTYGMTNEELDGDLDEEIDKALDLFMERYEEFKKCLRVSPEIGHLLIEGAKTLGYVPQQSAFSYWLFHHLATWLETHP